MSALTPFDVALAGMVAQGIPREKAAATLRADSRFAPDPAPAIEDTRREKEIEAEGDRLMQRHGFEVIRFSHPGKTKQTEGIADRRYYRRPRAGAFSMAVVPKAFVVWVEFKSATGRQRPGQQLFQELVEACGEDYLLGGIAELTAWLQARGIFNA